MVDTGDTGDVGKMDFHPSETIVNGLRSYGIFVLIGWISFEVARRRLERAYYPRERSPETASPVTVTMRNSGIFGWIWPMYSTSDEVILQSCGMDTLFFLRFLRMCQKIAWMGILVSFALFPIYYYGQRDNLDVLYRMTLSHLDENSDAQRWRYWFATLAMYIIAIWTCYLFWVEFGEYVKRRHEFLSRKDTQQYSIVINGLPKHLRTQQTLRNYMEVLFPKSVVYVYVALECGDLEKLVKEREKVRDRLEHALAWSAKNGERALARTKMCGDKVDAIELYQGQLKSLNDAVEMEVRAILRNQAALASQMLESNLEGGTDSDVPTLQVNPDDMVIVDEGRATESAYIKGLRKDGGNIKNTDIMRGAAFVTFNKLRAAQSAQQVLQCSNPTEMHVEAAPHVEAIVWENIGISYNQKSTWGLISFAASTAIILFWTIPTAFIVTLSKVENLRKDWAWLDRTINDYHWIGPLLEQLAPLMLSVMSALAPIILGILSKREGHASAADVERSLLNKLVAYQWYIVFLLPILGGTFLNSLLGKVDENGNKRDLSPTVLINDISKAMPAQSSFFITYLMVQMGLPTSLELLRVTPIIKAAIYHFFAPKLTPRQRSSPWFGLAPLSVPGDFGPTDPIAQYVLVLILILVFAVIAPSMSYFTAFYLFLSELMYRWNVLCVSDPSPNTGAVYWPALYRYCMGVLLFAEVVVAIVLGLKRAALPATFALILPIPTVLFHLFLWSRYPRTAVNLPLDECVLIDNRRHRQLEDLERVLEDIYKQPAMAERAPLVPDYHTLASDPNGEHQISSPVREVV